MEENKFKAFLKDGSFTEAMNRNFVYDAVADQDLPDPQSWEVLEDFITRQWKPDALPKALDDAKYVWGLYDKERQ